MKAIVFTSAAGRQWIKLTGTSVTGSCPSSDLCVGWNWGCEAAQGPSRVQASYRRLSRHLLWKRQDHHGRRCRTSAGHLWL